MEVWIPAKISIDFYRNSARGSVECGILDSVGSLQLPPRNVYAVEMQIRTDITRRIQIYGMAETGYS